jgi:glycosyltransferase involved in cell wall biosynthesis
MRLAYNGLDTGAFRPDGNAAELPWRDPCVVIGVACALRPEKGLPTLLDAFARVLPARPEARLLIVGSGPLGPALEKQAQALGLGGACHFQPAVQQVAEWLRAIRIFVLPSLSEALSNSLMEAMGCGCCAVASATGGNPELVTEGETGLLFPPGDAAALAGCLDRLLRHPEERRRLSEAGSRWIRGGFSVESAARQMGRIYAECLESASIK